MSKINTQFKCVISGVTLLSTPCVFANTSSEDGKQVQETVVVTASGYEQEITNAAATISVLTREEIESRYYRDVTDALSSIPGVIISGGGDSKEISIRGMSSSYTLILVDGKKISTRLTRPNSDGPGIEAGWLPPLASIERIEVIKGPMSTLYGSDAIGGVINIITRKSFHEWQGKLQVSKVLQENRNSGDEFNGNFFMSGSITDDLAMQVYGQQHNRDEDDIANGYADRTLQNVGSKLSYQLNDRHQLDVDVAFTEQKSRQNSDKSYSADGTYNTGTSSTSDYRHNTLAFTHTGDWQDLGKEITYIQTEYTSNPVREITLRNTEFKSIVAKPFSSNTWSYGLQGNYQQLHDETTNTGGDITKLSNTTIALFSEDEWRVIPSVAITIGARYDYDENYGSHVSPRAYSVWNINDNWTLKGGVSTGFNAPDVKQSSNSWVKASRGGNQYGNPDLKPETSVTEEINLAYHGDYGVKGSLGLFNNDFKDMITTEYCTAETCDELTNSYGNTNKRYINVDKAVTRGVESELFVPITETVDVKANYTYTYSKQKTGDSAGDPLNNLPKHLFSGEVNWQTTYDLQSWTKVTYHGEESSSSEDTPVPSYTFVDAGISYVLNDSTKVNFAIYNLLDKDVNYDDYGYVEDGRRYWLGLDVSF